MILWDGTAGSKSDDNKNTLVVVSCTPISELLGSRPGYSWLSRGRVGSGMNTEALSVAALSAETTSGHLSSAGRAVYQFFCVKRQRWAVSPTGLYSPASSLAGEWKPLPIQSLWWKKRPGMERVFLLHHLKIRPKLWLPDTASARGGEPGSRAGQRSQHLLGFPWSEIPTQSQPTEGRHLACFVHICAPST